jgi:hypothetical protein
VQATHGSTLRIEDLRELPRLVDVACDALEERIAPGLVCEPAIPLGITTWLGTGSSRR